ncbi:MAG: PAS domain-containing sensor histidine kinase [Flavobacterium sp. JAD_PAG50586_2]|nr:MAG: PAS domain-containing sensor histidine kinase [Flavobacterium sp. JAD_PAG50586_2]
MNETVISRFELHKVADFLPYPFIIAEVIDGIHYNTFVNEKFSEEIGYTLEEIPTIETWYEHAYPDEAYRQKVIRDWDEEEINSKQEGKVFVKMKSHVTCKKGMKKWYEIKASVIDKLHVVAFVDIDKEIALQQELKNINSNNDRMLSVLGHDLRAPINNLKGITILALEDSISQEEFTPFIQKINEQSEQVLEMLETTLNWAKLNFNSIQLNNVAIDIKAIVSSILAIHKNAYQSKNIRINLSFDKVNSVFSDSEIVTIIVRNMISNAIKFTPQDGEINIGFSHNILSVTDNGVGMTQNMINDIMKNNYTSKRGTNNELGMGMGLQLTLNLAAKVNAEIGIESELGKGTSIRLIF